MKVQHIKTYQVMSRPNYSISDPAYLIRYSAEQKEPLMFATWAKTRSEAVSISYKFMETFGYDEAEIWRFSNLTIIAKTTRN